jgi:hypothetical protein
MVGWDADVNGMRPEKIGVEHITTKKSGFHQQFIIIYRTKPGVCEWQT